jgi:hypothetical protein
MIPAIKKALEELQAHFPSLISWKEVSNGSVEVAVERLDLGPPYKQQDTWFGFTITPLVEYADVYPHFVRPDLSRTDGVQLGQAFQQNRSFYGRPAVQVSRRAKLSGPEYPVSPLLKLLKVHQWMLSQ